MGALLKQALAANRVVRVFGLGQLCHPKVIEMVVHAGGYDAVWLDQEHGGLTIGLLERDRWAGFVNITAPGPFAAVMRPSRGRYAVVTREAVELRAFPF